MRVEGLGCRVQVLGLRVDANPPKARGGVRRPCLGFGMEGRPGSEPEDESSKTASTVVVPKRHRAMPGVGE